MIDIKIKKCRCNKKQNIEKYKGTSAPSQSINL